MSPAATLKRGALLVFALAVFATPVKANELWVVPAKNPADKLSADFAVAQKKTHFGFGVPDNFSGFTRATVLLIGSKDKEISYDLTLSISRNLASDTASVTMMKAIPATVFKDQLLELDVSAIFNGAPALEPGTDYVSLSIDIGTPRARRRGEGEGEDERNESSSNDTGNPHALLFGLRFQYAGPLGPTGPEGPKGEMGSTGPRGPAGATGAQGSAGTTGPQGSTGATGPQGEKGPRGEKGMNFHNAYDATTSYAVDDVVTFRGSSFIAKTANTGVEPVVGLAWSLVAQRGDTGATGQTGATGATGATGERGAIGPQGPAGPSGGGGSGGLNGTQEFTATGTFTVPSGVTRMFVELFGAGGGGGGGTPGSPCFSAASCGPAGSGGGGGGSGAYVRSVVSVVEGATYDIVIGSGGLGGSPGAAATAGADGTNTEIRLTSGGALLIAARAGSRGGATVAGVGVVVGGAGGTVDASAMISRPGKAGSNGTWPQPGAGGGPGQGGAGGGASVAPSLPGVVAAAGGNGGNGGASLFGGQSGSAGAAGAPGYAIIVW